MPYSSMGFSNSISNSFKVNFSHLSFHFLMTNFRSENPCGEPCFLLFTTFLLHIMYLIKKIPDFSLKLIFPWTITIIPWIFPDICLVWNFLDFPLTAGHPAEEYVQIMMMSLYEMETLPTLLVLCEENQPVTGGFPSQRLVTFLWSAPEQTVLQTIEMLGPVSI